MEVGDTVKILKGNFEGSNGEIKWIAEGKKRVGVLPDGYCGSTLPYNINEVELVNKKEEEK